MNPRLLPFENALLMAVLKELPPEVANVLSVQVGLINRVQRLLAWNEIEFYCMRWWRVRWPESSLLAQREQLRIAEVDCTFQDAEISVSVWVVGGHIFSLESPIGLKQMVLQSAEVKQVRLIADLQVR